MMQTVSISSLLVAIGTSTDGIAGDRAAVIAEQRGIFTELPIVQARRFLTNLELADVFWKKN